MQCFSLGCAFRYIAITVLLVLSMYGGGIPKHGANAAPIGFQDLMFGPTVRELQLHCKLVAYEASTSGSFCGEGATTRTTSSGAAVASTEAPGCVQTVEDAVCEANTSQSVFSALAAGHGTLVFQLLGSVFYQQGPADVEGGYTAYDPQMVLTTSATIVGNGSSLGDNFSMSVRNWQGLIETAAGVQGGPARSLLGSSMAVFCDPTGYMSGSSNVITGANLNQACAMGDYSALAPSTATPASLMVSSYLRHHLRGSVFAISWDRAAGAEAFPSYVTNFTVAETNPLTDTILYEQATCANPIPDRVPVPPIPSVVGALPASSNTGTGAGQVLHIGSSYSEVGGFDCRRVATRLGAIAIGASQSSSSQGLARSFDIIVNNAAVACEPTDGSFLKSAVSRPSQISMIRPHKPHRPTERTAAASTFAFTSPFSSDANSDVSDGFATKMMGWEIDTETIPQSIFAGSYVTPLPFAYAEMSPARGGYWQPTQANPRSPYQRGTRVIVQNSSSGASSGVVGLVGLSVSGGCQASGAAIAYYPLTGVIAVSRNLTVLARYLMENLRIFGPESKFGFQIDFSLNYGAPMTSTSALTLASTTDANIAWFEVMPSTRVALGATDAEWDSGSSSSTATASVLHSTTQFAFPMFDAAAVGTCASGRRVISEQLTVPQGQPITSQVKVILAAPQFGGLIITRGLYLGMRAWTNLSCYAPSESNEADVASMGGLAAFRHAASIEDWSSHPLVGSSMKSTEFHLCYTVSKTPQSQAGSATSSFPTFTIHPDSVAGGGTFPSQPATSGGISTSRPTTLTKRSLRIRIGRMGRPHAEKGTVVPLYIATPSLATGSFVVLGSGALTDFLLVSDSNAGRIGFVPAQMGSGLTPLFATTSSTSSFLTNNIVGASTPAGGLASSLLQHSSSAFDGDLEGECSVPTPCSDTYVYVRALNLCADPQCGSWIRYYNENDNTCGYNGPVVAGIAMGVLMAVALEITIHLAFLKEFLRIDRHQINPGKKEV